MYKTANGEDAERDHLLHDLQLPDVIAPNRCGWPAPEGVIEERDPQLAMIATTSGRLPRFLRCGTRRTS